MSVQHKEIADMIIRGLGSSRSDLECPVHMVLDMEDINDTAQIIYERLIVLAREADIERFKI